MYVVELVECPVNYRMRHTAEFDILSDAFWKPGKLSDVIHSQVRHPVGCSLEVLVNYQMWCVPMFDILSDAFRGFG